MANMVEVYIANMTEVNVTNKADVNVVKIANLMWQTWLRLYGKYCCGMCVCVCFQQF